MKNQSNSIRLSGPLSPAEQLFAGKYQHKQESMRLSPYQEKLFALATRGFDSLTKEERAALTYNDRKIIERSYGITKRILNDMRQRMMNNTITQLYGKLFPNGRGAGLSFLMMSVTDPTLTTRVPLKIPKEALVRRLVQENVLPRSEFENFAA